MSEARMAYTQRLRWLACGIVLLGVLVTILITRGPIAPAPQAPVTRDSVVADSTVAGESPVQLSPAEKARRAAIAALGPIDRGPNGAELYREAMNLFTGLTDDEKKMLSGNYRNQDPRAAAALYSKVQPIMALLRQARDRDYVNWDAGQNRAADLASAVTAQVNDANALSLVADWEADYRFQSDPAGAVDDIAATDFMAHSVELGLPGILAAGDIHLSGLQVLADNASAIPSAAQQELAGILDPTVIQESYQSGMINEAEAFNNLLADEGDPAAIANAAAILSGDQNTSFSPEQIKAAEPWMAQTAQELATKFAEPTQPFWQWWESNVATAPDPQVVQNSNLYQARGSAQATVVGNLMFQAGLALGQGNQTALETIIDPFTGEPFVYSSTATGYTLTSPGMFRGEHLTMTFPAQISN
jgi:hypothetical protein